MFLPVHFRPRWIFLKKEKSVENLVTLSLDPRFLKILIHLGSLFICRSIFAQSFDFTEILACAKNLGCLEPSAWSQTSFL